MFVIKTELKPSTVHGIGVFTLEPIKKGQRVVDLMHEHCFTEDDLLWMPSYMKAYIKTYSYREGNQYRLPFDNSRFLNDNRGTTDANIGVHKGMGEIALRDIEVGEELISDYVQYEPNEAPFCSRSIF